MRYKCLQRPYPPVHVVTNLANVHVSFGPDGILDSVVAARQVSVPHETIEKCVEALPQFTGKRGVEKVVIREGEPFPVEGEAERPSKAEKPANDKKPKAQTPRGQSML